MRKKRFETSMKRSAKARRLKMRIQRIFSLIVLMGFLFGQAQAAEFPTKPVNLLVGYEAGGPTDVSARALAAAMEPLLGQSVVVVNKPGGSSAVQLALLATAKADGYTIGFISGAAVIIPYFQKVNYDLAKDFTYLHELYTYPEGLSVKGDAPWKTLKDLIEYARKNPNSVKIGTPGTVNSITLIATAVGKQAGVEWTIVPFKGDAPAITALLGGHIQATATVSGHIPQAREGQLRIIATATATRMKDFPDVPTFKDLGFDYVTSTIAGIAGPKGLPEPIAKKLEMAVAKAAGNPAYVEACKKLALQPQEKTGKDYESHLLTTYQNMGDILKKWGMIK
jgi:tripartite-type tricarboxylate transporter receptor subunit TctC